MGFSQMDNHDLERRLTALEEGLAALKNTVQRVSEGESLRSLKIELSVEAIQDQLKEYDMVRAAAFGGYFATHPEVRQDLTKLEDILGTWPPEPKKPPSTP